MVQLNIQDLLNKELCYDKQEKCSKDALFLLGICTNFCKVVYGICILPLDKFKEGLYDGPLQSLQTDQLKTHGKGEVIANVHKTF